MTDTDKLGALWRDIVVELTNHYHETYRYDQPNDTVEQLVAFCRDIAENEVDELLTAHTNSLLAEIEEELPSKTDHIDVGALLGKDGNQAILSQAQVAYIMAHNSLLGDVRAILEAHRVKT